MVHCMHYVVEMSDEGVRTQVEDDMTVFEHTTDERMNAWTTRSEIGILHYPCTNLQYIHEQYNPPKLLCPLQPMHDEAN